MTLISAFLGFTSVIEREGGAWLFLSIWVMGMAIKEWLDWWGICDEYHGDRGEERVYGSRESLTRWARQGFITEICLLSIARSLRFLAESWSREWGVLVKLSHCSPVTQSDAENCEWFDKWDCSDRTLSKLTNMIVAMAEKSPHLSRAWWVLVITTKPLRQTT